MKIAHVRIPDFPIQVEILDDSKLRRRPVVIGGLPSEDGDVRACSPAARRDGVQIGMALRQAEQLSPDAIFLPIDSEKYKEAHGALLRCLEAFSPLRQTVALGEVCIDASGLEGLFGPDQQLVEQIIANIREETGLISKAGLTSNRYMAATAAELADLGGARVVPHGDEMAFLAPLGIAALPASEEAHALLNRLGIVTLGQVAELPAGALSRTLGKEGERLHRLARGIDDRPLIPEYEDMPLSARITLEWQLEYLPALVAYAEVLVGQLSAELEAAGMAAGNVIVEVEQEGGEVLTAWGYLRPASGDRDKLLERAAGLLESLKFAAGANGMAISLTPLEPQHLGNRQMHLGNRQMQLGNGNALTPDPLGHTLRTIRIRFGDGSIRDAAAISGPPPEAAEVRIGEGGAPSAVFRNGNWSRIETVQLHWRLEGDWWWEGPSGAPGLATTSAGTPAAHGQASPGSTGISSVIAHGGAPETPHAAGSGSTGIGGRKDYFQVVTWTGEILVLLRTSPNERWYLHPAAKPSEWPVL